MPSFAHSNKDKVESFWANYSKLLAFNSIKHPFDHWYVIRVKHYIKAHPDLKLAYHSDHHVDAWLTELGRNNKLEVWQFKQVVFALKILFDNFLHLDWAINYPWDQRISAYSDQFKHALPVFDDSNSASTSPVFHKERNIHSLLGQYSDLLEPMVKCIRLKHYSIRTEPIIERVSVT